MTREEQLEFCKICKKQGKDIEKGIVCSLTGDRATFDGECDNFESDEKLVVKQKREERDYKQLRLLGRRRIVIAVIVFALFVLIRIIIKVGVREFIKWL